jgi:uncharacterized protein YdcH (DUF465 family)
MNLKRKHQNFKLKVDIAEKKREQLRDSTSWLEIRDLKKKKLAIKDAITLKNI